MKWAGIFSVVHLYQWGLGMPIQDRKEQSNDEVMPGSSQDDDGSLWDVCWHSIKFTSDHIGTHHCSPWQLAETQRLTCQILTSLLWWNMFSSHKSKWAVWGLGKMCSRTVLPLKLTVFWTSKPWTGLKKPHANLQKSVQWDLLKHSDTNTLCHTKPQIFLFPGS